jgi:hypothetical protein
VKHRNDLGITSFSFILTFQGGSDGNNPDIVFLVAVTRYSIFSILFVATGVTKDHLGGNPGGLTGQTPVARNGSV